TAASRRWRSRPTWPSRARCSTRSWPARGSWRGGPSARSLREMRAVVITGHGGPEVLQVQQRPDPQARAGEVLIDVAAAGINFADLMARLGFYPDAPKPPCVVGYEVAGTIAALGPGVDGGLAA